MLMIHWEMSWEIPSLAKAKLSVNAETTMSIIIDDVLTADRIEVLIMSKLTIMDWRSCPSTTGYRSCHLANIPVEDPEPFTKFRNHPMIDGPELLIMASTKAPVTPNAAASVGVAQPA